MNAHPLPPKLKTSLSDLPRAGGELSRLCWQFLPLARRVPQGQGQPVMCISGYGGGDSSMYPLRQFLKRIGYTPVKADIGVNLEGKENRIQSVDDALAFRSVMVERLKQRVEEEFKKHQQKIVLIGWSMGGLFALDVSQELPDKVAQVITLGTPFGDPRGTSTFKLLRWLNKSEVPIESQDFETWLSKRNLKKEVPVTVLYSNKDGIVGEGAARLNEHDFVGHSEVDSSHIGFAINPKAYEKIAHALSELQGA